MSETNITTGARLKAISPVAGEAPVFSDTADLLAFLVNHLYVTRESGMAEGVVTFGSDDPQGEEARESTLHVLKDSADKPIGLRVWSREKFVDFYRLTVGEVKLFPVASSAPDGWVLANGFNSTPDLTDATPHESLAYYQFRGF